MRAEHIGIDTTPLAGTGIYSASIPLEKFKWQGGTQLNLKNTFEKSTEGSS